MGSTQIFLYPTSNMVGIVLIWVRGRVDEGKALQMLLRNHTLVRIQPHPHLVRLLSVKLKKCFIFN